MAVQMAGWMELNLAVTMDVLEAVQLAVKMGTGLVEKMAAMLAA